MTPAELAQYQAQGFVHVPNVLGEHLEPCRASLTRMKDSTWRGPWTTQKTGGLLTTEGLSVHKRAPWPAIVRLPELQAWTDRILGGPTYCQASMALVKPPDVGQAFPWHQDSAYYGDLALTLVLATVYLDDVTEENGSMLYVPGSHREGRLPHVISSTAKRYLVGDYDQAAVRVEAKAGDVVLFDHHLVHGSRPNRSAVSRRAVRLVYQREA